MSRAKSVSQQQAKQEKDPNSRYRLFDFPDSQGAIKPGRLSNINKVKPHLVVSLHLAASTSRRYHAMNPVLCAPYSLLNKGRLYLKGTIKNKTFFYSTPYNDWFNETSKRNDFQWFLNDTALYFTGYPLDPKGKIDLKRFMGYRYNMLRWGYNDPFGWEIAGGKHREYTRYSQSFQTFIPQGKFWNREKSKYEKYRRDEGEEGFGGDNAYASYEIIRYMLLSLHLHHDYHKSLHPGKSYISVWIMPLHVNAINAFIELGYLNRRVDRNILTKKQNELAEGIAIGIYSLLAGIKLKNIQFKYLPKGKKLNLKKYLNSNMESYFDLSTP